MEYSVLMTIYKKDNPQYFKMALMSMVKQTKMPDEIVLVKDGPVTDELQKIIDDVCKIYPDLIVQVQLSKNKGLGRALNEGIKVCKNDIIARMDSDDYSMPERCEKQLKEFEKNPSLDIVGCPVKEFVGDINNIVGERTVPFSNEDINKFVKRRDPFNHPTVMYKKSSLEKVGCYSDYRKNQDTDLWIKMFSNGSVGMNLPEPLVMFRFDDNTYKKRKSWVNTKTLIEIRWKSFRKGFNSLSELIGIAIVQMSIYILPISFQRFVYNKILRR